MARSNDIAVPPGADTKLLSRRLSAAHDEFVSTGLTSPALRQIVIDSWKRSVSGGLDPEYVLAPIVFDDAELTAARAAHPLAAGMPVIRKLLVESAAEAGLLVAVSDAAGRLLWVEGSSSLRSLAEGMHFVEGSDWSEAHVGTNAPGTALALDRPVQIFGPEHLARQVTPWSCSAAPIHDPETGALLGVLDLTGGSDVAGPQSLSLVRATVAAVEAELRIARMESRPHRTRATWHTPTLEVLGVHGGLLSYGTTSTRLSLRHSEMLLLLAVHEAGLTVGEMAVQLSEEEMAPVTVRAEFSRLRGLIGPLALSSRPYRLDQAMATDVVKVREALDRGELRRAVAAYRGPILPQSEAPGIVQLRGDLHAELRATLMVGNEPDALLAFADAQHNRDDLEIWQATQRALPAGSPRAAQVQAHIDRLEAELA
ncbi:GAF domain-containing protein [soil metagenome]